jgi:Sulfotransferase family
LKDFSKKIPLIGVGPGRTASTWLYHILVDTKLVECARTKEISYFNQHYNNQLAWYRNEFTDTGKDYWVDITPQYIDSVLYCKRIYKNFPDAYILMGVRDPIDRIRSLFKLLYYNTKSTKVDDYEQYLEEILPKQIIIGSRVAFLSRMYQDRFVVIPYEALKRDPATCAQQVLSRCGIVAPPPAVCNYVVNSLYTLKCPRLAGFGKSMFRPVGALLPPALAWRAKAVIAERLLMRKVLLEEFLGEKEFERMIRPHLALIDRDRRIVEGILAQ